MQTFKTNPGASEHFGWVLWQLVCSFASSCVGEFLSMVDSQPVPGKHPPEEGEGEATTPKEAAWLGWSMAVLCRRGRKLSGAQAAAHGSGWSAGDPHPSSEERAARCTPAVTAFTLCPHAHLLCILIEHQKKESKYLAKASKGHRTCPGIHMRSSRAS